MLLSLLDSWKAQIAMREEILEKDWEWSSVVDFVIMIRGCEGQE